MSWLRMWLNERRMRAAYKVLSENGLAAVRVRVEAGSTYIETVDGQLLKLGASRERKR